MAVFFELEGDSRQIVLHIGDERQLLSSTEDDDDDSLDDGETHRRGPHPIVSVQPCKHPTRGSHRR